MKRIKIIRTTSLTYNVEDNNVDDFYAEEGAVNIDMAALADLKALDDGVIDWYDLENIATEDVTSYEVKIVEQGDDLVVESERNVDKSNKEQDLELFPAPVDEEVNDEKSVAGDLNAGSTIY